MTIVDFRNFGWPRGDEGWRQVVIKLQVTKNTFGFVEDSVGRTEDLAAWSKAAVRFRENKWFAAVFSFLHNDHKLTLIVYMDEL